MLNSLLASVFSLLEYLRCKLCPQRTFKFKENVLADSMSVLIINVVNEASFPVYIDKYRSHLCFDCSVFTTNLDSIGNLLKHSYFGKLQWDWPSLRDIAFIAAWVLLCPLTISNFCHSDLKFCADSFMQILYVILIYTFIILCYFFNSLHSFDHFPR